MTVETYFHDKPGPPHKCPDCETITWLRPLSSSPISLNGRDYAVHKCSSCNRKSYVMLAD